VAAAEAVARTQHRTGSAIMSGTSASCQAEREKPWRRSPVCIDAERVSQLGREVRCGGGGVQIGLVWRGIFSRGVAAAAQKMDRVTGDRWACWPPSSLPGTLRRARADGAFHARLTAIEMRQLAEPSSRRRAIRTGERPHRDFRGRPSESLLISTDTRPPCARSIKAE